MLSDTSGEDGERGGRGSGERELGREREWKIHMEKEREKTRLRGGIENKRVSVCMRERGREIDRYREGEKERERGSVEALINIVYPSLQLLHA